jgi:long-chain acyl-CoA synthetase
MATAAPRGLPLIDNVAASLEATARRRGDAPALTWTGGDMDYLELERRAARLAGGLVRGGVRPGDFVAVVIGNTPELVVAVLGGLKAGAAVAPVDVRLTAEERAAILDDLHPACVLQDATLAGPPVAARATPGPALVLYTSGSTGRPKGAVLSHAALGFALRSWAEPIMMLTPEDAVLAVLPLSHAYGIAAAFLAPLLAGARVVLVERFSVEGVLGAVARQHVTVLPAVATMFRRLLDSPCLDRTPLGSLRLALSGAAPCPWELAREWRERTGVRIVRGYGMSELFRPISYLAGDAVDRPDSIGRAVPGVDARIVDDAGRDRPAGEMGELWIRSPAMMDGYLGAEADTRAVMAGAWFRTGDLATMTPDGWIAIAGRQRERIKRGGDSIFPSEVETVLASHPAVAEAAVVGVAHAELGEEVAAFVALVPGAAATADELITYCRERLAAFKAPRTVTVVAALPKAATGKVLKSRLSR